ncbi:nucleoside diphosphate kinase 7 [Harmonia axyridis]|uniref:nucleoside diphosphate kinase 7 n=1 Tax=Harmonia axyridis TaxID=115357 RepID=UPI001E279880|nr:nucleoside diphosphate kinase 7 [Harmonia axyridis]XP_045473468.1 nucleoside diphosphate kinase 7 [Harmonia axyridis]
MSRNLSDYDYREKLTFLGEYFDHDAYLKKKFIISYFPCDDTIEIFDRDMNRVFLKRSLCEGIGRKDMFVGNLVRIYGRQISIKDYGDCRTKEIIGKTKQRTFVLIKPSAMDKLGDVIADIESRDFQISRMRMCNLTRKQTLELYEHKKGDAFLPFILEHIVSGSVVALELVGTDAIERFKKEAGPNDPIEGRKLEPNSLRAKYGQQTASNGFHCASDIEEAVREACFFFPEGINKKPPETTVVLKNSTCCIVKPHAIQEGKLGYILKEIYEANFKITAMQMFYLSNANADEFLEVYKGVVSDFHALLLSFLDGPLVAIEISGKNDEMNVHKEFRDFAGPSDPDIARQIRPYTLRAKFGNNKYKNAIHCTDLPEDTILELEYFFKILND